MTAPKISVLLVEDHALMRQGLRALLGADGGFHIVGEARTGREAVTLAGSLRPDVILMDIAMPILNGFEATRQILAINPHARILILSAHSSSEYVERLMATGATGFLEKQSSVEVLSAGIRAAARGETFFSHAIGRRRRIDPAQLRKGKRVALKPRLSSRESEVLQLVTEGLSNKQMADQLGISIKTVEKHRQHLMDKLDVRGVAGLTRYAIAHGVIENDVPLTLT